VVQDGATVTIERTTIAGNLYSGMQILDASRVEARAVRMVRNAEGGAAAFHEATLIVEDSTVRDNGSTGVQVADAAVLRVSGCEISGHRDAREGRAGQGIGVVGTSGASIRSNSITDNDHGIAIAPGVEPDIGGNEYRGNGDDVVRDATFNYPTGTMTTTTTTTTTEPVALNLAPGTPYGEEWVVVGDETNRILVAVPAEWDETRSGPFSHDGEAVGFSVTISSDVDALIGGWGTPGIFVGAANEFPLGVEEYLDTYDLSADCTYAGRTTWEAPLLVGLQDVWIDCGAPGGAMRIVVGAPVDGDGIVVIHAEAVTQADFDALGEALSRIVVLYGPPR
jgi:hypothetical protein